MLHRADPDHTGEPETALEMSHLHQRVWEVAKKLPERQRTVLTRRGLQGLSYSAIAGVMGVSDATVETLLHRARKLFKEECLLLVSPAEEHGRCAQVAYLLETVGRANLRERQQCSVAEHLGSCECCRRRYLTADEDIAESLPARALG